MSKASFILIPVSNDDLKDNMAKTVADRDVGYWTAPAGSNGDKVQLGDQIWFIGGKNQQGQEDNCVQYIGNVTNIIDPETDPEIHSAMASVWEGDWSNRKIIIFRNLPVLSKDLMSYSEVCELFDYTRLKNGATRVNLDN
jgi:hypothetical protein